MLRFLKIRIGSRRRRDGKPYAVPLLVEKPHRFSEPESVKTLSRKTPVIIEGAASSGKTRMLQRLHAHCDDIWGVKHGPPVYLSSVLPVSGWVDAIEPQIKAWAIGHGHDWDALKVWQRVDLLPSYVADMRAVVFLDDAQNLSNSTRKCQVARDCLAASRVFVISTTAVQRLPPNIRECVLRRSPQIITLSTDAAYDATAVLFWCVVVILFLAGAPEAAALVGLLKLLGGGRWAARQN